MIFKVQNKSYLCSFKVLEACTTTSFSNYLLMNLESKIMESNNN